jgi:predicted O-methyltransferase YrrM
MVQASSIPFSEPSFRALVQEIYTSRLFPQFGGGSVPMNCWIPRDEGDLLYQLIRDLKPHTTIEIGLANGLSTLFITAALEHNAFGAHIAIDPFQSTEWQNHGVNLVKFAGFDGRLRVIEQFSHHALPRLEAAGITAQLAFIDGAHLFHHVIGDFLCLNRIVEVNGLLAFDDSDWPSVRKALRYILRNHAYVPINTPIIEEAPGRPSLFTQSLRRFANLHPRLGKFVADTVLHPDSELRLRGRCVVLRKSADDRGRDTQQIADFADF